MGVAALARAMQELRQSWRDCHLRCGIPPAIRGLDIADKRHSFGLTLGVKSPLGSAIPFEVCNPLRDLHSPLASAIPFDVSSAEGSFAR
jgi:hypothetical protein